MLNGKSVGFILYVLTLGATFLKPVSCRRIGKVSPEFNYPMHR